MIKKTISKERMYEVLRKPSITEKTAFLSQFNKYTFLVAPNATKNEVKLAVEGLFNVKVEAVNTLIRKGKTKLVKGIRGVRNDNKKAIVTLKTGQTLDVSTGV